MDKEFSTGAIHGPGNNDRDPVRATDVATRLGALKLSHVERQEDVVDAKEQVEAGLGNNLELGLALKKYEVLSKADALFNPLYPAQGAVVNDAGADVVVNNIYTKIAGVADPAVQGDMTVRFFEVFDISKIKGNNPVEDSNVRLHVVDKVFNDVLNGGGANPGAQINQMLSHMSNDTILEIVGAGNLPASAFGGQILAEFNRRLRQVSSPAGINDPNVRDRAKLHFLDGILKKTSLYNNPNCQAYFNGVVGAGGEKAYFEGQKKIVEDKIKARGGSIGGQNANGPLPVSTVTSPPITSVQPTLVGLPLVGTVPIPRVTTTSGNQLTPGAMPHNSTELKNDETRATADERAQFKDLTDEIDALFTDQKQLDMHLKRIEVQLRIAKKTELQEGLKLMGHKLKIYGPLVLAIIGGVLTGNPLAMLGSVAGGSLYTFYQTQIGQAGLDHDMQEGNLLNAQTKKDLWEKNRTMGPREYVARNDAVRAKQHADAEYVYRLSINPDSYKTDDQKKTLKTTIDNKFFVDRFQMRANVLQSQIQQMFALPGLRTTNVVSA
jgi:hypothetical protein